MSLYLLGHDVGRNRFMSLQLVGRDVVLIDFVGLEETIALFTVTWFTSRWL